MPFAEYLLPSCFLLLRLHGQLPRSSPPASSSAWASARELIGLLALFGWLWLRQGSMNSPPPACAPRFESEHAAALREQAERRAAAESLSTRLPETERLLRDHPGGKFRAPGAGRRMGNARRCRTPRARRTTAHSSTTPARNFPTRSRRFPPTRCGTTTSRSSNWPTRTCLLSKRPRRATSRDASRPSTRWSNPCVSR